MLVSDKHKNELKNFIRSLVNIDGRALLTLSLGNLKEIL